MEELEGMIATADAEGKGKKKEALEGKKTQLTVGLSLHSRASDWLVL